MLTGPGLNWWSWGSDEPTPPGPSEFWCANTGNSGMAGGDIDVMGWFVMAISLGTTYALS